MAEKTSNGADAACTTPEAEECAEYDLKTLDNLRQASKTPEGRARLAATGTLTTILRRLSSTPNPLLLRSLQIIRNLCIDDLAKDAFLVAGGPDRVASVLVRVPPVTPEIICTVLQLLGNFALGGDAYRAAVWGRFFPTWFIEMAKVRLPIIADPLCMVLDSCCTGEGGRRMLAELCEPGRGLLILHEVVATARLGGYKEEWLEWLLCKCCIEEPHFSLVFSSFVLDNPINAECRYSRFTPDQAFLLRTLACYLNDLIEQRVDVVCISREFSLGVLKVLKGAYASVDFTSRDKHTLPTGFPAIDVLGFSLIIIKDICVWGNKLSQTPETPVDSLLSAGLVEVLLLFLRELEPPAIIKISHGNAGGQGVHPTSDKKVCPYQGFRKDVVAVIAICLNGRRRVQDEVRQWNGIPLLLQQCVVDEDNSFLREWGIFAVRSLLEGNMENQHEVAELELKEPVTTPQIAGMGLKVEINEKTRQPKLVNAE